MAVYNFDPVPAYGASGGLVRLGTKASATFPVTKIDGSPATVVQGGNTQAGFVLSDANGLIPAFTTTDIPSVRINFGSAVLTVHSLEAISAGAASAAAAAASATAAADARDAAVAARDSTISGLASKEPAIAAGTTSQYLRGDKSWQTLNKAAVGLGNVDNTSDLAKPISTATQAALDLKLGTTSGIPVGTTGRSYRMQLGAIRNDGSGWALINDTGHRPSGFGAVTIVSNRIRIAYDTSAFRVGSLQATPDETFKAAGITCGASVGTDYVEIELFTEPAYTIADFMQYTGSVWQSFNGVFSGLSYNGAGVLTLTHEPMGTTGQQAVMVTARGTAAALAGAYADTTSQVVFYTGSWGSLTATGAASASQHRAYVVRHGRRANGAPRADPTTISSALGNIWLTGFIEV